MRLPWNALFFRIALLAPAAVLAALPAGGPPSPAWAGRDNPLLLDAASQPVMAHPFEGKNLAGDVIRLEDLKGKLVFLNFWATWCPPCVLEMPAMERLNRKMSGQPFAMLAVNQAESRERIEGFLAQRKFKFSYQLLLDLKGEIGAYYAVDRLPITYLIDPRGRVTHRAVGPREWDSEEAVAFLETLMEETKTGAAQPGPAVENSSAHPAAGTTRPDPAAGNTGPDSRARPPAAPATGGSGPAAK